MRSRRLLIVISYCLLWELSAYSQDSSSKMNKIDQLINFPSRFFDKIQGRYSHLDAQLTRQTDKYLKKFEKQENKIRSKLAKIDPKAQQLFATAEGQYSRLTEKIKNPPAILNNITSGEYQPFADSIKTSLSFLAQNNKILSTSKEIQDKIQNSLSQVNQLQSKLKSTQEIKAFIRQRKQQLNDVLSGYTHLPKSINRSFNNYKREAYYYSSQVKEYQDAFNKAEKLVRKGLSMVSKLPGYQQFMKKYSELSGLFNLPGNYGNAGNLAGLQTRNQVLQIIQTQLSATGTNGVQLLQQNVQAAKAELNNLKDKIKQFGQGSGDMDMPDFKPNNQRTKTFWKRLEYGTNLQTTKSNFFPTTTDLGLSVGYKLNDKSTVGIGASYKMGWGQDIKHIAITHLGLALRSYLDVKLKGSFFASGGFEFNHQPLTDSSSSALATMHWDEITTWQKSGLVGISKIVSIKSKFFKKTKLQLLWDFLSYQQIPRSQPLKFRVGYHF